MTNDELKAWANDPRRADTLPYGLLEPRYQKGIVGAALVVRGVLYVRNGHTPAVRQALSNCFTQYRAAIEAYQVLADQVDGRVASKTGPLRWLYEEGQQPVAFDKAPGFERLARSVPDDTVFSVSITSAEHKLSAGFFEFSVFCTSAWQAKAGGWGLDALVFTVPRRFLELCPGTFPTLFADAANALPTVHGHAGFAVNVPPMGREPNEASEVFLAQRYGPGLDVGDPLRTDVRDMTDRIKTVDWLTALDAELLRKLGGATSLSLPPDWFGRRSFGDGGLIIQAGVAPQTGVSAGPGKPPVAPPAYVLLNDALRPIVATTADALQDGTLSSNEPLLSTTLASEAWLRRLNVAPEQIPAQWVALHATPKLGGSD
ncbi:Protein of unknown function [Paraburkholderia phenazinium]|uniref:DUF3396 domain-containing protein n=1 Tax=Paraburkholderia phenazinium TaxID=60549 RepID=A0A1G7Y5Z7_9BURK|nr:DUF3396 domain-containing protein [Paraburkholderia phenazinium]SDG91799.1 Protein of unknown function [Paraburkholderia phenazinium]